MPYAINVKATGESASAIRALWAEVELLEVAPSMRGMNYPPHLTLAIYDEIDTKSLVRALSAAFQGRPPLQLTFDKVLTFNRSPDSKLPLVLWAAPSASRSLVEAYRILHRVIDPASCRPNYRPDQWTPHCTLGLQIASTRMADALALADRPRPPFQVVFDVADAVSFYPVRVIEEVVLRSV